MYDDLEGGWGGGKKLEAIKLEEEKEIMMELDKFKKAHPKYIFAFFEKGTLLENALRRG